MSKNNLNNNSNRPTLNDGNKSNNSRPVSFYDNYGENGNNNTNDKKQMTSPNIDDNDDDENYEPREITFEVAELPSQLYCLKTTVPQNIVSTNIAGRHTPTRNSLRHSRMIVMHKTGKGKCILYIYISHIFI